MGWRALVGLIAVATVAAFAAGRAMDPAPLAGGQPPFDAARVAALAQPAVVAIAVEAAARQPIKTSLQPAPPRVAETYGSGFFFAQPGLILTNAHVVAGARRLSVKLADGSESGAVLVGSDTLTDLAVLSIGRAAPAVLQFGDAAAHRPGDPVVAIGNPLELFGSVSVGVISGLDRAARLGSPPWLVQHDAPINPGSSGGPLLDAGGRVIGINCAVPDGYFSFAGIAFAIPARVAEPGARELVAKGGIARGELGLWGRDVAGELARSLGLAPGAGVVVEDVQPGGPAAAAGLKPGDLIVAAGRVRVTSLGRLVEALASRRAGDGMRLAISRGEGWVVVPVRLAPSAPPAPLPAAPPGTTDERPLAAELRFAERGPAILTGVAPGSSAAIAGLKAGDQVLAVERMPVADGAAAEAALAEAAAGPVALLVKRAQNPAVYVLLGRQAVPAIGSNAGPPGAWRL